MGLLSGIGHAISNVGSAIKKGVVDTGHAVGKVASNPIVQGGVGLAFGPAAAAAVGGLGHLIAPGGNVGKAVAGAAEGYGAGTIGHTIGSLMSGGDVGANGDVAAPQSASAPRSSLAAPSAQGGDDSAVSLGFATPQYSDQASAPLYQGITSIGTPPARNFALPRSRYDAPQQIQEVA